MMDLALTIGAAGLAALGVSAAIYAIRPGFLPRGLAALVAPVLAMLLGFAFVAWAAARTPPDGFALHLLVLSPPFALAIFVPIGLALLAWVFCTRRPAP
jgi:hypothetical protein